MTSNNNYRLFLRVSLNPCLITVEDRTLAVERVLKEIRDTNLVNRLKEEWRVCLFFHGLIRKAIKKIK